MIHRLSVSAFFSLLSCLLLLAPAGCARNAQTSAATRGVDKYVAGMLAYRAGQRDQAVASMLEAVRENQRLTMARIMLAEIYQHDDQHQRAVEQLEQVVILDPYTFSNHYHLGFSYQVLERFRDAASSYRRALELEPDDPQTHMNLGVVYLALDQPADALRHSRQAVESSPGSAEAHAALARVLDAQGQYEEAEKSYRRSLDIKSNPEVMMNLAGNLLQQTKSNEAISALVQLIRIQDSPAARKRLADALVQTRNFNGALREYAAALQLDPDYYPALNEMGMIRIAEYKQSLELDDDKRQQALQNWRKSMEINPAQPAIATILKQWERKPLFVPDE